MSHPSASPRSVLDMASASTALVECLTAPAGTTADAALMARLAELGFLPGESLTVLRRGPGGHEPIAVQIGDTVFALRAIEAACVQIHSLVTA